MPDVFVSYVSEDRAIAEKIASGLEGAGFSVWWDRHIHGGVDFATEIERQLSAAKIVIVLWSAASLESKWVRDEAQQARDDNKLIPVRLDSVQPPLGFRQAQTLDFSAWKGDPTAGAFADLVESAQHFMRGATPSGVASSVEPQRRRWGQTNRRLSAAAILLAVAIGVLVVAIRQAQSPSALSRATEDSRVEIGEFELLTRDEATGGFAKGLTRALARTFAAKTITTLASSSDVDGSTNPTEFVLRGTVDRENQATFVVSTDVQNRRDRRILWSAIRRQDTDEAGPFRDQVAILVASVMDCALTYRRVANGEVPEDVFSLFLQYCEAETDYKLDELDALTRRIVDAAPQLAVSRAMQAAAAARQMVGKSADEVEQLRKTAYESARMAQEKYPGNPNIDGFVDWLYATIDDPARGIAERERLLQKSLRTNPWPAAFYSYGTLLTGVGRMRAAASIFNQESKAFPLVGSEEVAYLSAALGNSDVAREEFKADARIWPADSYVISRWFWAEFWYGDPEVAKELARHPGSVTGNRPRLDTQALGCFTAVLEARSKHAVMSEDQIASVCPSGTDHLDGIYAYFGHVDAAYRIAQKSGGFMDPFDPYMWAVRTDPRFMPLVARPALIDYWLETNQWPDFCAAEKLPYDCKEAALKERADAIKVL